MTFDLSEPLVKELVSLAREAGDITMTYYNTDFDVRSKGDNTPVTEADEKAEILIRGELDRLTPEIPFIGEEAYAAGHRPDISGGLFWLVDALDGTKEFVHKRDEFTVNIALVEYQVPVFGVVHAPAVGDTYWGSTQGAWKSVGGGQATEIASRLPPEDGITVVASRSHRAGEDEFLEAYTVKDTINSGSSLKFCLIAEGRADLYPRLAGTSEWDTAAGHAVLTAAGGSIETLEGGAFLYGKADIGNPHFLAKGRQA